MFMIAERGRTRPGYVTGAAWACIWALFGTYLIWGAADGRGRPARPAAAPASLTRAASLPATASPPTAAASAKPIQNVRVGDRVLTRAPEPEPGQSATPGVLPASEPSIDAEEVDPATWRRVDLSMPEGPGGDLEIVLLRPSWWVESAGARAGEMIPLDLPEMGAVGAARVARVAPCPPLRTGQGRVVTGTYTHSGSTVLSIGVEGLDEPVGATPMHPFYSASRRCYVAAKDLAINEVLLTSLGETRVTSIVPKRGKHRVYNLEVHGDHVYRVTPIGVLVHNNCPERPQIPGGKAPDQVTPGTGTRSGVYDPPSRTATEPYTAYYDKYGRQIGRTDYTCQPDPATHTNPHHHIREYGPGFGPKGLETGPFPGPYPEAR